MKLIGLIVIAIIVLFFMIPGPHSRMGRDLIFYSGDLDRFHLPSGKLVETNQWYEWEEVLDPKQEFYTQGCTDHADGLRLGIVDLKGLSTTDGNDHVHVNNYRTQVEPEDPGASFQEFWVRNGNDAHEE